MWVWDKELGDLKQNINSAFKERERLESQLEEVSQKRHMADQTAWGIRKRLRKLQSRNTSSERLIAVDKKLKAAQEALRSVKKTESQLRRELEKVNETFDSLTERYKQRLDFLRKEYDKQVELDKELASLAKVPPEHLNNIKVVHKGRKYQVYFGGIGKPDGWGHGHYSSKDPEMTYRRLPFRPHGRQNYVKPV